MSGDKGVGHDLDLGDGHWLDWSEYEGVRCGGVIVHTSTKTESGFCAGSFWIKGATPSPWAASAQWDLTGPDTAPTLSPSFLCHCGDHGWIQNGKWVRA